MNRLPKQVHQTAPEKKSHSLLPFILDKRRFIAANGRLPQVKDTVGNQSHKSWKSRTASIRKREGLRWLELRRIDVMPLHHIFCTCVTDIDWFGAIQDEKIYGLLFRDGLITDVNGFFQSEASNFRIPKTFQDFLIATQISDDGHTIKSGWFDVDAKVAEQKKAVATLERASAKITCLNTGNKVPFRPFEHSFLSRQIT